MEKGNGKISVILPVYNGAAWLEECVQSILAQTFVNFELLILDDNSTDGTTELAERLSGSDSRIRLICREKKGVSSARNQGLEETDGEYVTFVDADDKIDCEMLQILLRCLTEEKSDLAFCDYYTWDEKKEERFEQLSDKTENWKKSENKVLNRINSDITAHNSRETDNRENSVITVDRKTYLSDYLLRGNTRCWSILYRRKAIGDVRFREDLTIGEDMMFLMDLLPGLSRVTVTGYKGYYYRVNAAGAMLRPFTLSYMDEVKSWKLAGDRIARDYPQQKARVFGILAVSAMLAAGKLALLSSKERKKYRECILECRHTVRESLLIPGAKQQLPRGYSVKTAIFTACPSIYLWLYHLWKNGAK